MRLYYVLEWRDECESFSPLYITSNKDKAIKWWLRNTDESLGYFIVCKEQQFDDVYLKCDLDDLRRDDNYFAGLWQYYKTMNSYDFMDKYCSAWSDRYPEIIDLDELQKDNNSYGIKYLS